MPQDWFAANAPQQSTQAQNDWFSQNAPSTGTQAKPTQPTEPGLFETLGGWKGIGAGGLRALGSLLGAEGGWTGAAIGGSAESLAELLQEGKVDPTRVGTEAALTAIPLAKVFKAGAPLYSAVRGGLYSGVGEGARELASGGVSALDPSKIAAQTGLGAASGGVLSRLFGQAPAAVAADFQRLQEKTAYGGSPTGPEPYRPAAKAGVKAAIDAAKQRAQEAAQQRVVDEIVARGMEPQPPSISEAASGKLSMRIPYAVPDAEDAIERETAAAAGPSTQPAAQEITPTGDQGSVTTGIPANPLSAESSAVVNEARSRVASPSSSEQAPTGQAPEPSSILKFFKTPGGATGANYRSAVQAAERGEIPSYDTARASRLLTIPGREQEGLDLLKKSLGMAEAPSELPEAVAPKSSAEVPTPSGGPDSPAPSTVATTTPTSRPFTPEEVAKENDLVDRAAQMPGSFRDNLTKLVRDESGSISPALAQHLIYTVGGGALGGAYGAATSDDPLVGGLKGAALGALIGNWVMPGEEQEPGMGTLGRNLLDLHRASLLSSIGPQSKKVVGDIGGLLSEGAKQMTPGEYGNPAVGRQIIKNTLAAPFQPSTYKTYWNALRGPVTTPGVMGAIGDISAEAQKSALGAVAKPFEAAKAVTQDILERSGEYSPDVLAKITGTNQPETATGQAAYNAIQRAKPLQWLMPFSKLPINVAEGIRNVPGVAQAIGIPNARQASLVGLGQGAIGALEQLYNEQQEAEGTPVSPLMKGLQTTAMGVQGVAPNLVGKALASVLTGGHGAAGEIGRLVPSTMRLPPAFPNETDRDYVMRMLRKSLEEVAPSPLAPEGGMTR